MSGFKDVTNAGGIYERAMFAEALQQKSNNLKVIYNAIEDSIKRYEAREGYREVDEHKERLLKVKKEIEELSVKINNTVSSLRG